MFGEAEVSHVANVALWLYDNVMEFEVVKSYK